MPEAEVKKDDVKEENVKKEEEKPVDIDTSGPDVDIKLPEETKEEVEVKEEVKEEPKEVVKEPRTTEKELEVKAEEKPKEVKKEAPTEETVKTDTGDTITITPTGEGVTPASAIAKGLEMVSGEDAADWANETAQELNEDNYDNIEEETDDLSDVINKCGRGI